MGDWRNIKLVKISSIDLFFFFLLWNLSAFIVDIISIIVTFVIKKLVDTYWSYQLEGLAIDLDSMKRL